MSKLVLAATLAIHNSTHQSRNKHVQDHLDNNRNVDVLLMLLCWGEDPPACAAGSWRPTPSSLVSKDSPPSSSVVSESRAQTETRVRAGGIVLF